MPSNINKLFVSDSRSLNFKHYKPRSNIDFIVQRGAKLADLLPLTLTRLRTYAKEDYILLKLAAGINDFTTFTRRNSEGKRTLTCSTTTANELITQFWDFKRAILACHPKSVVSFVTIPPASFSKFQFSRQLSTPIFSTAELLELQNKLDQQIDIVNAALINENKTPQFGILPRTLSWHTSVRKPAKRRNRAGRLKKSTRNNFSKLYDGLHACSDLKHHWFTELCRSFNIEEQRLHERI